MMAAWASWLELVVRLPVWLLPAIVLSVVGLIVGAIFDARRGRKRVKELADDLAAAREQVEQDAALESQVDAERATYRSFIYNVSHEVANPLQSIQTNLDNMATCSPDEVQRWKQYHAIVENELRRLIRMTENLRTLSRFESDYPRVREPVNLTAVVEDVIMAMCEGAEARGVTLQYACPKHAARVLGNRDTLRQVLTNLVDNGIKYAKEEGGHVLIRIQEVEDHLRVSVSDDGIGIPEDELPHIFDVAYRALDARNLRHKGSGLGLAIAKRIVEEHGGALQVESGLGQGTTFSFDLQLYFPAL